MLNRHIKHRKDLNVSVEGNVDITLCYQNLCLALCISYCEFDCESITKNDTTETTDIEGGCLEYLHRLRILCHRMILADVRSSNPYLTAKTIWSHYQRVELAMRQIEIRKSGHWHKIAHEVQALLRGWHEDAPIHRDNALDDIIKNAKKKNLGT